MHRLPNRCPRIVARTLFTVLVASLLVAIASTAVAQTDWINTLGGGYHTASNWSSANVPDTAGESAQFNILFTYLVSFPAANTVTIDDLFVLDGNVTWVSPGAVTYNTDDVTIAGGDLTLLESIAAGRIDLSADVVSVYESSTLTFDGGSQSTPLFLQVGDFVSNTAGNVHVLNGSTLEVFGASGFSLGLNSTGTSSMLVDGAGSMVTTSGGQPFDVGINSGATLDVTGGATVFADRGTVRIGDGVFGSRLTIDSGSTFTTHDTISGDYGITIVGASTFFPATVEVFDGSVFEPGQFQVRGGSDVTVDGPGSRLSVNLQTGLFDSSTLTAQGGATLELLGGGGSGFSGTSSLIVTGAGTTLSGNDVISMNGNSAANPVSIQILDGAVVTPAFGSGSGLQLLMGVGPSTTYNELIVDGAGTLFDSPDYQLQVEGVSTVLISNGGTINHDRLDAGTGSIGNAMITVDGGTLNISNTSTIGGTTGGTATMNLLPGGLFNAGADIVLNPGGTINLFGGQLKLAQLSSLQDIGGAFNWNNGTVRVDGGTTLTPTASSMLLPTGTLGFGRELRVVGNLTLQSTVTLDGGTLAVEGLNNASLLQLQSGTFEWLDSELIIDSGEALGDSVDLGPNLTIKVQGSLTNQGLITGDGTLSGQLVNSATGVVRVEQGKSLDVIDAESHTNAGDIQLLGGRLDVSGNLNNTSTGSISGRGTLVTDGLTNAGQMLFSAGLTDVFGTVDITGGTGGGEILVSGLGTATFYDDVTHNGDEIRTSAGSATVFFGDVFGPGPFTGTGAVFMEAGYFPGSSPAAVSFAADLSFGSGSLLEIELGGLIAGDEYDQLQIGGTATLDGTLMIDLIDGFRPEVGDAFEILAYGSLDGAFDDVQFASALDGVLEYGASSLTLTITAVPEPASVMLFLIAMTALLANSRFHDNTTLLPCTETQR